MSRRPDSAVTLLEIMISVSIIALVSLAIFGINYFGQFQINTTGRWARVQNEVSYFLEHIAKSATKAVNDANYPAVTTGTGYITIWTDTSGGGAVGQGDGKLDISAGADKQVAYIYNSTEKLIEFYPNYFYDKSTHEHLTTNKISSVTFTYTLDVNGNPVNNYFEVQVTGCYDVDGSPKACGTTENPSMEMRSRIQMPGASSN